MSHPFIKNYHSKAFIIYALGNRTCINKITVKEQLQRNCISQITVFELLLNIKIRGPGKKDAGKITKPE